MKRLNTFILLTLFFTLTACTKDGATYVVVPQNGNGITSPTDTTQNNNNENRCPANTVNLNGDCILVGTSTGTHSSGGSSNNNSNNNNTTTTTPSSMLINETEVFHVRLVWDKDPSGEITILWDTSKEFTGHKVYYGQRSAGVINSNKTVNISQYGYTEMAETTLYPQQTNQTPARYVHKLTLQNLSPNSIYFFTVVSGNNQSREYHFKTAPLADKRSPVQFLLGGYDGTNKNERHAYDNFIKSILIKNTTILAFIHGGNYTDSSIDTGSNQFAAWNSFLDEYSATFSYQDSYGTRLIPIIPVQGPKDNKEQMKLIFGIYNNNRDYEAISTGVFFMARMNTSSSNIPLETDWFQSEFSLQANQEMNWKIALYNRPAYPVLSQNSVSPSTQWTTLFDENSFDLVFEGGNDVLKETHPLTAGAASEGGVIYIGDSGRGNNGLETIANPNSEIFANVETGLHAFVLTGNESMMAYEIYTLKEGMVDYSAQTIHSDGTMTSNNTQTGGNTSNNNNNNNSNNSGNQSNPPVSKCAGLSVTLFTMSFYLGTSQQVAYESDESIINLEGDFIDNLDSIKIPKGLMVTFSSSPDMQDPFMTKDSSNITSVLYIPIVQNKTTQSIQLTCTL